MSMTQTITRTMTMPSSSAAVAPPQSRRAPVLSALEVESLPLNAAEETVAYFMSEYPQCGTAEQVGRFIQLVKAANWKGIDLTHVVRAMYLDGTLTPSTLNPLAGSRVGGMDLSPDVKGKRGKRGAKSLPSLLWEIAHANCGNLDMLNRGIEEVLDHTFGLNVPQGVTVVPPSSEPPSAVEVNAALTDFFLAHPSCSTQPKKSAINQLLNLIDQHHLNGTDISALFSVLGLENVIKKPRSLGTATRYDRGSIAQQTAPRRGRMLEQNVLKMSLLWKILSEYCDQLEEVLPYFINILATHPVGQTSRQRSRPPRASAASSRSAAAAAQGSAPRQPSAAAARSVSFALPESALGFGPGAASVAPFGTPQRVGMVQPFAGGRQAVAPASRFGP